MVHMSHLASKKSTNLSTAEVAGSKVSHFKLLIIVNLLLFTELVGSVSRVAGVGVSAAGRCWSTFRK